MYADDYIQSHNIPCNSRIHKWKPCNLEEIKKCIAIIIGMTVDGKTRIETTGVHLGLLLPTPYLPS